MKNGRKTELPWHVIKDIMEFREENGYDYLTEEEINFELDKVEALREYLEWNGIIGYSQTIARILE